MLAVSIEARRHPAPRWNLRIKPAQHLPRYEWRHPDPRRIASGHCVDWLAGGWRLLLAVPGVWLQRGLLFVAILFAVGVVPLIGWAVVLVAFRCSRRACWLDRCRNRRRAQAGRCGLFIAWRHAGNLPRSASSPVRPLAGLVGCWSAAPR